LLVVGCWLLDVGWLLFVVLFVLNATVIVASANHLEIFVIVIIVIMALERKENGF
jgi:hypothetical protein